MQPGAEADLGQRKEPIIPHSVFVIAASSRSLLRSVVMSGGRGRAFDLFADQDSLMLGPVTQANRVEDLFPLVADSDSRIPVLPGSGAENHLQELRKLEPRLLCGPVDGWQVARDPYELQQILKRADLPGLRVQRRRPSAGEWIAKPTCSGGGRSIYRINPNLDQRHDANREYYFQEFKTGRVLGASFIASRFACQWIGVCEQIIQPLGQHAFTYHGSIGPVKLDVSIQEKIRRLGKLIAKECQLRGWFGMDVIVDERGGVWLLEVNPRYPASLEILERGLRRSLFPAHWKSVRSQQSVAIDSQARRTRDVYGKQYVFNTTRHPIDVDTSLGKFLAQPEFRERGFLTDRPRVATSIQPLSPICTVWTRQADLATARSTLAQLASAVVERAANGACNVD